MYKKIKEMAEYINTIRYADDIVILSDLGGGRKEEDLQHLPACVNAEGQEMGLNMNINRKKLWSSVVNHILMLHYRLIRKI
ncbi:hypothetical protein HUJ04_000521 [Dendroctonus ponderosae]|nr:hypothetical protein HUJ04_000521 [Dendroctonus ponderosae]